MDNGSSGSRSCQSRTGASTAHRMHANANVRPMVVHVRVHARRARGPSLSVMCHVPCHCPPSTRCARCFCCHDEAKELSEDIATENSSPHGKLLRLLLLLLLRLRLRLHALLPQSVDALPLLEQLLSVSCYLGLQLPMLRLHSPQHRPRRVLVRMTRDLCDT